jgi:hypothetical protein
VSPVENAVLHVNDEEGGVRPVFKCGHGILLLTRGAVLTSDRPTHR